MLESVAALRQEFGWQLAIAEWFFTVLFTVEYGARMLSVSRPLRYAKSFFGIIDLLAILPTYLSLIITGTNSLLVIRVFRLLRIFRVFKLRHYLTEVHVFENALRNSRPTDHGLPGYRYLDCTGHGNRDVSSRRRGIRLHQHPAQRLLGGCDDDNRRLR